MKKKPRLQYLFRVEVEEDGSTELLADSADLLAIFWKFPRFWSEQYMHPDKGVFAQTYNHGFHAVRRPNLNCLMEEVEADG